MALRSAQGSALSSRRFGPQDAYLNENTRKIQDAALVDNPVSFERVNEGADGLHVPAGCGQTEKVASVRACDGHDQGDAIAVDEQVSFGKVEIRKRGEPHLIDSLNLGPSFEDAAGRTDNDGIIRVIGREGRRIMREPGFFPTLEHRRDFFASHRMALNKQAAKGDAGTIGRPRAVFNRHGRRLASAI